MHEESEQAVGFNNIVGMIMEDIIDTVLEQPAQVVITPHLITLHLVVHYLLAL